MRRGGSPITPDLNHSDITCQNSTDFSSKYWYLKLVLRSDIDDYITDISTRGRAPAEPTRTFRCGKHTHTLCRSGTGLDAIEPTFLENIILVKLALHRSRTRGPSRDHGLGYWLFFRHALSLVPQKYRHCTLLP